MRGGAGAAGRTHRAARLPVRLTRDFLAAPQRYLRHLLAES
ncbi:hypothetical protein [Amycolatopsis tucumanensis]|nr:hypothetical protein [Amycolatopsis tucumanensis]